MESSLFPQLQPAVPNFWTGLVWQEKLYLSWLSTMSWGIAFAGIKTSAGQTTMVTNYARARRQIVAEHQRGKLTMARQSKIAFDAVCVSLSQLF